VAIAPSAAPAPVVAPQSTATIGIDDGWLDATSAAIGIPRVALDAYALAATAQREATPGCGLGWNTLAGLGYAESAHGTLGGAHLDEDGRLVGSILGPLLDGTRYAAVPDTDGGVLDGSATWDRAVGPLQFLPATWAASALDGDADGVTDPNDVFDAARTAAAYLCSSGRSMGTGAAWAAGIRSYNPNDSYVDEVLAAANRYATAAG
jgi:membrane-bound lytic murein transglycosylase B